jgi:hypothetical protein
MATTMYFEETLRDQGGKNDVAIELEFGSSTYYPKASIYLVVNGETVILDEATGRKLVDAMAMVAGYLGYDRPA